MCRAVTPFRLLKSTLCCKVQCVCILNDRCLTDALLLDGPTTYHQEMPSSSLFRFFSLLVILTPLCGQTQWSFLPKPHMRLWYKRLVSFDTRAPFMIWLTVVLRGVPLHVHGAASKGGGVGVVYIIATCSSGPDTMYWGAGHSNSCRAYHTLYFCLFLDYFFDSHIYVSKWLHVFLILIIFTIIKR